MVRSRRLLLGVLAGASLMTVSALVVASASGDAPRARVVQEVASPLPLPPAATLLAGRARVEIQQEEQRAVQLQADADVRREEARARRAAERERRRQGGRVEDPAEAVQTISAPTPTATLDPADADQSVVRADVLDNGIALPPLESPPEVRAIIEAGNGIARTPYLWGGGHGKWQDKGYDCSGSVSFALASAGLLDRSQTSGQLLRYGKPGRGRWVTIWTNEGHVFLEVAGVRFDTTARKQWGSRWQNQMRSRAGFVARHPPGL